MREKSIEENTTEIEKAKKQKFLMVYDDLFYKHSGIDQSTIVFKDLKDKLMGRGAILKNDEIPNYDRFLPKEEYIKDSFIVVAATNNKEINKNIGIYCRSCGKLVNVVDDIKLSNYTVPSYVKRGDLLISISTGGKSPSLSSKIKKELEKYNADPANNPPLMDENGHEVVFP